MKPFLSSFLACAVAWTFGGQVRGETHVRYRLFIRSVTESRFRKVAEDLLRAPTIRVGVVKMFGSKQARLIAGPLRQDHCGYGDRQGLREEILVGGRGCFEMHEALKIGSKMVFRSVDAECRRRSQTANGENPLRFSAKGAGFEILDINVTYPLGKKGQEFPLPHFYVRVNKEPSEPLARAAMGWIKATTQVSEMSIVLRSDTWFLDACGFPTVYEFSTDEGMPSREQYYNTKYVSCSQFQQWPIRCSESMSGP